MDTDACAVGQQWKLRQQLLQTARCTTHGDDDDDDICIDSDVDTNSNRTARTNRGGTDHGQIVYLCDHRIQNVERLSACWAC